MVRIPLQHIDLYRFYRCFLDKKPLTLLGQTKQKGSKTMIDISHPAKAYSEFLSAVSMQKNSDTENDATALERFIATQEQIDSMPDGTAAVAYVKASLRLFEASVAYEEMGSELFTSLGQNLAVLMPENLRSEIQGLGHILATPDELATGL
jgi:hypothetical protein